jgi:hypothetical protein
MKLKILILMLALAFVGGCSSYSLDQTLSNVSEPEFNGIINASIIYTPINRMGDNFTSFTIDYNYEGKELKYYTIIGATCHQIECKCSTWGCAAYCMECEGVKN